MFLPRDRRQKRLTLAMTGAQASYLKTLSEEASEGLAPDLSEAEASRRIFTQQEKTGRGR